MPKPLSGIAIVVFCLTGCSDNNGIGGPPEPPSKVGEPCAATDQCDSGQSCLEVEPGQGKVCTENCSTTCSPGYSCQGLAANASGGQVVFACVPDRGRLCQSCAADADCPEDDLCLALDGGNRCGRQCEQGTCPAGYSCTDVVSVGGAAAKQCVPEGGSCACRAGREGLLRGCSEQNQWGTCVGVQSCGASGWGSCSAVTASEEICNGQDDDCDGSVDNLDDSLAPPAGATEFPACTQGDCTGVWRCAQAPSPGWVCDAPVAATEVCNNRDDDCDDEVDEGFVGASGAYDQLAHCGQCGLNCETHVPHLLGYGAGSVVAGAVACEVPADGPACVVKQCDTGYVPFPPGSASRSCVPVEVAACRPCSVDEDCGFWGDACVALGNDDNLRCAPRCDVDSVLHLSDASDPRACTGDVGVRSCCPQGFLCQPSGADQLCFPENDSCECSETLDGLQRQCTLPANGQPAYCAGVETCLQSPPASGQWSWSACDVSSTTLEACNGLDDDCDGEVDELFIDTQGTGDYDTEDHCGACGTYCALEWNADIHHVVGACVLSNPPACAFADSDCQISYGPGGRFCYEGCLAGDFCLDRTVPGVAYNYGQCGKTCDVDADCGASVDCVRGVCLAQCTPGAGGDAFCQTTHGALSECADSHCQVSYQWHNANGFDIDGCECPAATAAPSDEPATSDTYPSTDTDYSDINCDSIHGTLARAIFVSSTYTGSSSGSRSEPFTTIGDGIVALLADAGKDYLLVAVGLYEEQVVLTPGVRLYGGYSTDFRSRNLDQYPSVIQGPEIADWVVGARRGTVSAECDRAEWTPSAPAEIAGFYVYGSNVTYVPTAGEAGLNAYAFYVKDCSDDLSIKNNRIFGGRGGPGGVGSGGEPGTRGSAGAAGLDATLCASADCTGETQPGGAGGTNPDCVAADGAAGVTSDPTVQGNTTYNCGGAYCAPNCRYDSTVGGTEPAGAPGLPGANGGTPADAGGPGCGDGMGLLSGDQWQGVSGAVGDPGDPGLGGTGGGAGVWSRYGNHNNPPGPTGCEPAALWNIGDLGGTGGGGAAGGCGGKGGQGGGSGGGSFALFVFLTADPPATYPQIAGNIIERGHGGDGGAGGLGGLGGVGGPGGVGGGVAYPSWAAGIGGNGGPGGSGGPAGGGGGGCGGISYDIAGWHIGPANYTATNQFVIDASVNTGGAAGAGGLSPSGQPTANGASGQSGAFGTQRSF